MSEQESRVIIGQSQRIEALDREVARLRLLVLDLSALVRAAWLDGQSNPNETAFGESVTSERLDELTGGLGQ